MVKVTNTKDKEIKKEKNQVKVEENRLQEFILTTTFNKLIIVRKERPWRTTESISELLQDLKKLTEEEHSPTILKGGKTKMSTTMIRGNNRSFSFRGEKKKFKYLERKKKQYNLQKAFENI